MKLHEDICTFYHRQYFTDVLRIFLNYHPIIFKFLAITNRTMCNRRYVLFFHVFSLPIGRVTRSSSKGTEDETDSSNFTSSLNARAQRTSKIRTRFVGRSSRNSDGRYDYQTDARSGTFVSSFLVCLDIFDLLKRRIERRISNGREQCI